MKPKVSIVVPIYNVESYLRACIESALNQTLQEIEVLLLDDGSTDSSPAIMDYYAKQDERVRVVHKPNEGYGKTCNRGFDMAQGEYVAILESDDFIEPTMYQDLYACAIELGADVVKSPHQDCLDLGEIDAYPYNRWLSDNMPHKRLYSLSDCASQLATHQSIWAGIYKLSYLNEHAIRFKEVPGAGHVDIKFCVETLVYSHKLAWVDTPYYNYRVLREDSSTSKFSIPENVTRYSEMHEFFQEFPDVFKHAKRMLAAREGVGLFRYFKTTDFTWEDFRSFVDLLSTFDDEDICNAPLIVKEEKEQLLLCKHDPDAAYKLLRGIYCGRLDELATVPDDKNTLRTLLSWSSKKLDWLFRLFVTGALMAVLMESSAEIFPFLANVAFVLEVFFLIWAFCSAAAFVVAILLKVVHRMSGS